MRYLAGEARVLPQNSAGSNRRRLGHLEELLDMFSMEKSGTTNVCVSISITSKQSLVHQHVYDALVLLSKRQPMLRAVIETMANGHRYFEIKEINEVITMLDITTSDQGRTLGGVWGGAKPPLASECHQKSVPKFFLINTVRILGPKN